RGHRVARTRVRGARSENGVSQRRAHMEKPAGGARLPRLAEANEISLGRSLLRVSWLGGRDSLLPFSATPTKTSVFSTPRLMSVNVRAWIFLSALSCLAL